MGAAVALVACEVRWIKKLPPRKLGRRGAVRAHALAAEELPRHLLPKMASAVRTRNEHESRLAVQRARDERAKHLVVLMQHHLAQLGYSGALDALVADSGVSMQASAYLPPIHPRICGVSLLLCHTTHVLTLPCLPSLRAHADVRAGGQHRPARCGAGVGGVLRDALRPQAQARARPCRNQGRVGLGVSAAESG